MKPKRRPTFAGVGAGKAGTAWLYLCLLEHPDVYVPPARKELDYFSYNHGRGDDWYAAYFDQWSSENAAGEISPTYLAHDHAARRMFDFNPQFRLILTLRNPIERAYSHYCMNLRSGKASDDVSSEIGPDSRFVYEGFYFRHISRFLDLFPFEQMRILFYDDLRTDPSVFIKNAYAFIGVDHRFVPSIVDTPFHVRKPRPRFQKLHQRIVRAARVASETSPLARRLVLASRKSGWAKLFHRLNAGPRFPALSDEKRRELGELYRDDVLALSRLVGRDLDHWLSPDGAADGARDPVPAARISVAKGEA